MKDIVFKKVTIDDKDAIELFLFKYSSFCLSAFTFSSLVAWERVYHYQCAKTEEFTVKDNRIAKYAKALGHPARIAILRLLVKKEACVCGDIVDELPLSQSTVSQHLKELKDVGLIKGDITGAYTNCISTDSVQADIDSLKYFLQNASGKLRIGYLAKGASNIRIEYKNGSDKTMQILWGRQPTFHFTSGYGKNIWYTFSDTVVIRQWRNYFKNVKNKCKDN